MAAEPDKAVHAPGESGEIRVDLSLTGFVGRVHRTLAVTTDDPSGRFTDLTMTIDIPEWVTITPRFLFWRVGDSPDEKTVDISIVRPKGRHG